MHPLPTRLCRDSQLKIIYGSNLRISYNVTTLVLVAAWMIPKNRYRILWSSILRTWNTSSKKLPPYEKNISLSTCYHKKYCIWEIYPPYNGMPRFHPFPWHQVPWLYTPPKNQLIILLIWKINPWLYIWLCWDVQITLYPLIRVLLITSPDAYGPKYFCAWVNHYRYNLIAPPQNLILTPPIQPWPKLTTYPLITLPQLHGIICPTTNLQWNSPLRPSQ